MLKKKLVLIPLLAGLLSGFYSCNELGSGGNSQTYGAMFAVVDFNLSRFGGTTICTPMGELAASDPKLLELGTGDCIYINQFTVNFDNQPSDKYYTATDIQFSQISKSPFMFVDSSTPLGDYNFQLSEVWSSIDPFFKGNIFLVWELTKTKDQAVSYRLLYNRDEPVDKNGARNIYLQALLNGSATGTSEKMQDARAFDVRDLIHYAGSDTTINSTSYRHVKVNLNYLSGVEDGNPVYTQAEGPLDIAIFRED
jgi:hypothetical protein